LSAASVLSYAGAVTPLGSLAGYNYIQGTLGVNIVAGSASSLPNTAGTIYMYGANGTKIQNTLYVDQISTLTGSNLNIHPDSSQAVDMTRVQFIGMGSASNENLAYPVIRGSGNASLYGFGSVSATQGNLGSVRDCSNINNSSIGDGFGLTDLTLTAYKQTNLTIPVSYTYRNINLTSSSNINLFTQNGGQVLINGSPISGGGNLWSTYPATQDVDFSNHYLTNVAGIDNITFSNLVETPMLKNLDASNYSISNVADLTGNSNFNIRKNTIDPLYIRNANFGGQIILVGGSNAAFGSFGQSNLDIYHNSNALTLQGTPNIVMKSPISMSNNAISNVPTISNSAGTLTLQGTSVIMPCTLNMSNNAISNVSTINGGTILTNPLTATLNVGNYTLSNVANIYGANITFDANYPIVMNQPLNMSNNGIINAGALSGVTTINTRSIMYNPSIVQLDMGGNSTINQGNITSSNSSFDISNTTGAITFTSPTNIVEYAGSSLSVKAGGTSSLPTHNILMSSGSSPMYISSSNTISFNSPSNISINTAGIDMVSHPIINLSALNGHNLYQVGAWASTSTSAIASNTPTPVPYDTQLITPVGNLTYNIASNYFTDIYTGNYKIDATIQISSSGGGGTTAPLYAWIQTQGNVDLANSGRHIDIRGGETGCLVLTAIVTDPIAFRIMVSSSSGNCSFTTLPAITSPYSRPQIPASSISITLVS